MLGQLDARCECTRLYTSNPSAMEASVHSQSKEARNDTGGMVELGHEQPSNPKR